MAERTVDDTVLPDEVDDAVGDAVDDARHHLDADYILDALIPSTIDWRETVRNHPLSSIGGVALVGYILGRTKGSMILAGVTTGLSATFMRQLSDIFEGEFFDFE